MSIIEQAFLQIVEDTWVSTLGLHVEPTSFSPTAMSEAITVCVKISGAWDGELRVYCPPQLARLSAAAIFQLDADKLGGSDISDALSELVHIVGGNLKALLPQPVTLSLPTLAGATDWTQTTPQWRTACRLALTCEGHPFLIILLGDLPAAVRGQTQSASGQRLQSDNH